MRPLPLPPSRSTIPGCNDVCGFENDSVRDSSLIAKAQNCENVFSLKITESNLGCQVSVKIKVRSIIRFWQIRYPYLVHPS